VELTGADRLIAVTMTREQALLLTMQELSDLLGQVSFSADQLIPLVEDTDLYHPALMAWFRANPGETYISFAARPS
jgi:hypothetical protein